MTRKKKTKRSAPRFVRIPLWIERICGDRSRLRTALRWTFLASILIHTVFAPLIPQSQSLSADTERFETEYQRRIEAAATAGVVAIEIKDKITMPPPPPDPEGVVNEALSTSLTSDVNKVTSGLMSVELQQELAGYVQGKLKDELAAAAKNIAEGKLSEEEIKELHKKFQKKAHAETIVWRKKHLEKTQVERAVLSTTEWYEKEVSPNLLNNVHYELFTRKHKMIWPGIFRNASGLASLGSYRLVEGKLKGMASLLTGKWRHAGGKGVHVHPAWPGPGAEQAAAIKKHLDLSYKGGKSSRYPSWKHSIFGNEKPSRPPFGLIRDYFPHKEDEVRVRAEKVDELWRQALAASEEYVNKSDSGGTETEGTAARDKCFAAIRAVVQAARKLLPKDARSVGTVNAAVRIEVLRGPYRDELYEHWVDSMADGLSPLIRRMFKGQFKKGIIKHKAGVDEALKDFASQVEPLMRRDLKRMIPRKKFHSLIFIPHMHRSPVTGTKGAPNEEQAKKASKARDAILAKWSAEERTYVEKRVGIVKAGVKGIIDDVKEEILSRTLTGSLLLRAMSKFVAGVDYDDKVQQKLDARAMAMEGRGQDMASLTKEGVPDTSAPLVALMFGATKGHGANLQPVQTTMSAGYLAKSIPQVMMRSERPHYPKEPARRKGPYPEQAKIKKPFKDSPAFEAIPFLPRFPRLDGDLRDWGKIRPLVFRASKGAKPQLVYAAWNYQGFFFGYHVDQPEERFYYASQVSMSFNHNTGDLRSRKQGGVKWAYKGDYLRLFFDTLDARRQIRGDAHAQEFIVLPRGTESDPSMPGIERVIRSQRDATRKQYRGIISGGKPFPRQPPRDQGPDGSGPYRVTKATNTGYTCEVFVPRNLFSVPVFAPGWYIGFDCSVATGAQGSYDKFKGQVWATRHNARKEAGANPSTWGDLLLLGTDPRMLVQNFDGKYSVTSGIIPGHSYLLTIVDPDRNVRPTQKDTVLVSAEIPSSDGDVEVFILNETRKNSGVFRGVVNTQPGWGRHVQGVLEVMPGQKLGLAYIDTANARGQRKMMTKLQLPIVSSILVKTASR